MECKENIIARDMRIAVIGNVDSGKSSLVGTLVYGTLDDGRGSSRSKILRLKHEHANGRTSCISHHMMGFEASGAPVHQSAFSTAAPAAKNKSWGTVMNKSNQTVTFIDLAGHERYLKTTVSGLSGCFPHYACVVIGANMGISKMTREHIGIAIGLEIPFFVVITKVDIAPEKILKNTLKELFKLLKHFSSGKVLKLVKKSKEINNILGVDCQLASRLCPIFLVSSVDGTNISLLNKFLFKLNPRDIMKGESSKDIKFEIDDTFNVTGIGLVVSGFLKSGSIKLGLPLKIGPFSNGDHRPVVVKDIHIKRVPVKYVDSNTVCTLALRSADKKNTVTRENVRRGMFVFDQSDLLCTGFKADVIILYHPTTIKNKFQAIVHCGAARQAVELELNEGVVLRTGDQGNLTFKFVYRPEYLHVGSHMVFCEGSTRAFGTITKCNDE